MSLRQRFRGGVTGPRTRPPPAHPRGAAGPGRLRRVRARPSLPEAGMMVASSGSRMSSASTVQVRMRSPAARRSSEDIAGTRSGPAPSDAVRREDYAQLGAAEVADNLDIDADAVRVRVEVDGDPVLELLDVSKRLTPNYLWSGVIDRHLARDRQAFVSAGGH